MIGAKGFLIVYYETPSISIVSKKHQSSLQSNKTISAGQKSFFFKMTISPISIVLPYTSFKVGTVAKSTFYLYYYIIRLLANIVLIKFNNILCLSTNHTWIFPL